MPSLLQTDPRQADRQAPCGQGGEGAQGSQDHAKTARDDAGRPESAAAIRFGRLTVIGPSILKAHAIECLCDCGKIRHVFASNLRLGKTSSCGCFRNEQCRAATTTHGMSQSRTHDIWTGMKTRCFNANREVFPHYGGRGIRVCERWLKFENFLEDMGEAPNGLTLDRFPNLDGDYEPGNCRWATKKQQARNRTSSKSFTHNGTTKLIVEWAEDFCIGYHALYNRLIKHGWSFEDAVSTPVRKR